MTVDSYIRPGAKAHLVGIGGISMCSLAEILHQNGVAVTGSDSRPGPAVESLREKGISVAIGHESDLVKEADFVVRTAAVHDDNPEIQAARAKGIPVFERAQAFGAIMKQYRQAVCVAGTHGKTTTTSMVSSIALAAECDPSLMIGGVLPLIQSAYRVGGGDTIILEACEYCNSFLSFCPTLAVVLNVEADHLDFFKDLEDISRSFRAFAERTPKEGGVVIFNADDPNSIRCMEGIDRRTVTFGLSEQADVRAENIEYDRGLPSFDVMEKDRLVVRVKLMVPGEHNIRNALAAAAAALTMGLSAESIRKGLLAYTGTERRFEYHGECNGALVFDDYAHHPSELHALFDAAQQMKAPGGRLICAFQPHTYTRTKAFFEEFVQELSRPDLTVLADIYAAREQNTVGVTSADLVERIPGAVLCPTPEEIADYLRSVVREGDLVLTVGAGELNRTAKALTAK